MIILHSPRNPYRKHYNRKGRKAAVKIQKVFRSYVTRVLRKPLTLMLKAGEKSVEIKSIVLIQIYVRRHFARKFVRNMRKLYHFVACIIQRVIRSYLCRRYLRRDRAVRVIQSYMRKIFLLRCKESIHLVSLIQNKLKKRSLAIVIIQCSFRNFLAFRILHPMRVEKFRRKIAAKIIQRNIRKSKIEKMLLQKFLYEKEVLRTEVKSTRHLSYLIYYIILKYRKRIAIRLKFEKYSVYIQKIVRGYLGRVISREVRVLRDSLKDWVNPKYAREFMQNLLRNKIFKEIPIDNCRREDTPSYEYVRTFLPIEHRSDIEVIIPVFVTALKLWYKSTNSPLLVSEESALVSCFRNPVTSNIPITIVDSYIHMHIKSCRKHGRLICADCFFRQECKVCSCLLYRQGKSSDSVCVKCHHPPSCHRRCPLQLRGHSEEEVIILHYNALCCTVTYCTALFPFFIFFIFFRTLTFQH